jgi:ubiquinone/menaquinone biosynthesis C-methylase UbiE
MFGRLKAAFYDRLMESGEQAGFRDTRRELLTAARGRVLEVGAGTGLNVALYPDEIEEVVLVEPDEGMAGRLRRRVAESGRTATVVSATAESLPFPDHSFDRVVCGLVVDHIQDLTGLCGDMRRVLRPGGCLVLITSQADAFRHSVAALRSPLIVRRRIPVLVRGERATIFVATADR